MLGLHYLKYTEKLYTSELLQSVAYKGYTINELCTDKRKIMNIDLLKKR